MRKFKIYVLWTWQIKSLIRAVDNLPKEDVVVVINTLIKEEEDIGVTFCETHGYEYYITESNGYPAKGKNSVLKLFLESDNDYMVAIDGDDFLTPHGVKVYTELAQHPNPPDMVVLHRQPAMMGGSAKDFEDDPYIYETELENSNFRNKYFMELPFDKRHYTLQYHLLVEQFSTQPRYDRFNLTEEEVHHWAKYRIEFDELMREVMEDGEFLCRMVFHSRKAAEYMEYEEDLKVGEDTELFLKVKQAAHDNKLNVLRRTENRLPTYIYDIDPKTTSTMRGEFLNNWSWSKPLLDQLYKMDNCRKYRKVSLDEFRDSDFGIEP